MIKILINALDNTSAIYLDGQVVRGEGISTLKRAVLSQFNASVIILDLAMVDTIDGAGFGALLELREWAQKNRIEFRLENPNSLVANVFRITRLDSVFDISVSDEVGSAQARSDAGTSSLFGQFWWGSLCARPSVVTAPPTREA